MHVLFALTWAAPSRVTPGTCGLRPDNSHRALALTRRVDTNTALTLPPARACLLRRLLDKRPTRPPASPCAQSLLRLAVLRERLVALTRSRQLLAGSARAAHSTKTGLLPHRCIRLSVSSALLRAVAVSTSNFYSCDDAVMPCPSSPNTAVYAMRCASHAGPNVEALWNATAGVPASSWRRILPAQLHQTRWVSYNQGCHTWVSHNHGCHTIIGSLLHPCVCTFMRSAVSFVWPPGHRPFPRAPSVPPNEGGTTIKPEHVESGT